MKIVSKIMLILILIAAVAIVVTPMISTGIIIDPDEWNPGEVEAGPIGGMFGGVLGVIRVIGTIVSVVVLMIIGIKYVVGSAEQRAEYKRTMIPYIIGAVMLFGGTAIVQMIYEWAQNIQNI